MHTKNLHFKHKKKFKNNAPKNTKKCKKNAKKYKKMQKTHRPCKNHTKNAKNDILGITDILPGVSPYWLSWLTSFHHIGDNLYYCDILESVPTLRTNSVRNAFWKQAGWAKLQKVRATVATHWTARVWYRHNQRWLQALKEGDAASKSGSWWWSFYCSYRNKI